MILFKSNKFLFINQKKGYYNSSYYVCTVVVWYNYITISFGNWNKTYTSVPYLPFVGTGLTEDMVSPHNPESSTAYVTYGMLNGMVSSNIEYYIFSYKHMKVCACVDVCGSNGFKYALLWNQ